MINMPSGKTLNLHFYHSLAVLFVLSALLIPCESRADLIQEIDHLLSYIEHSGCTFVRNGKDYSAKEAREHIQRKYDYVKNRVKTTEDFILSAASESSLSGKPYKVSCDGEEMLTAEWLRTELNTLRSE